MGIIIAVAIAIVIYVFVAIAVSVSFCDFFVKNSETIRNLALGWGALLAIGLALWRSMVAHMQAEAAQKQAEVAQKQAEIAQGGLLADRYQRAVEMLGHDLDSLRIGGIHALVDIAREHPDEYQRRVVILLQVYYLAARPEEPFNEIQATVTDAFHTILAAKKGQEVLLELDGMRLRNSRNK